MYDAPVDPRISIITLGVSDLERSTRFYRDGLGLPLREPRDDGISFFLTSSTWLALYPRDALAAEVNAAPVGGNAAASPGFTLAHNVRVKEEVAPLLAQAEGAGARIVKPARDTDWGGYSGYFADPDGFLWAIAWNPRFWIE